MTRQETGIIMDILTAAYPRFYSSTTGPDMRNAIKLWADMFAHDEVALVAAAVKSVIESDEKGFPPTIGQVKAKLRLLTAPPEMTEAEAWDRVARAIRNGLYGAEEEFEKFPPVVQRIVGSPNTLREWARMDTETVHSVVSSNFQRSYRAISAREREINALPPDRLPASWMLDETTLLHGLCRAFHALPLAAYHLGRSGQHNLNTLLKRSYDISEAEAAAEGALECDLVSGREVLLAGPSQRGSFRLHYREIWESINGPGSWDANPWVWVIEFKRLPA